MIYYWVPLLIAAVLLGANEFRLTNGPTESPLPAAADRTTGPPT